MRRLLAVFALWAILGLLAPSIAHGGGIGQRADYPACYVEGGQPAAFCLWMGPYAWGSGSDDGLIFAFKQGDRAFPSEDTQHYVRSAAILLLATVTTPGIDGKYFVLYDFTDISNFPYSCRSTTAARDAWRDGGDCGLNPDSPLNQPP